MQIHASFPLQPPVSQPGSHEFTVKLSMVVRGGGGEAGTFWGCCLEEGLRCTDLDGQTQGPPPQMQAFMKDLCGDRTLSLVEMTGNIVIGRSRVEGIECKLTG